MLTKTDLNQIRSVVAEEVETVVERKLEPIKKDLKYLKKKVNRIDKTVGIVVKNYDEAVSNSFFDYRKPLQPLVHLCQ